jgi:two-component system LytT family sensor kinase
MPAKALNWSMPLAAATAAIWLMSFAIWTLYGVAQGSSHQIASAIRGFSLDLFGALACGGVFLAMRPLAGRSLPLRLTAALAMALGCTFIYMALLYWLYYGPLGIAPPPRSAFAALSTTGVAVLWTFLAWCGVYFSLDFGAALRDREERLHGAQAMAVDAQNRMLRYQIDPHFLFNIHSALATLIHDGRNGAAEKMVLLLSNFLRRSLEKDPLAKVTLAEELAAAREYLEIEAVRFGERLRLVERIDPQTTDAAAPSFILQPLVENAIKHGLGASRRRITIELGAVLDGDQVRLWVEDDGDGAAPGQTSTGAPALGMGLENVRRRLEALYGLAGRMTAEPLEPRGFRVSLTLPLERAASESHDRAA